MNNINNPVTNYEINEDSFKFVQADSKIHDTKFETKPTTFAKDAFKRFLKNKSSVVGAAIILFLILCTIILPFALPYKVDVNYTDDSLSFLTPKLFEAGTGFWDGTREIKDIPYDSTNNKPLNDSFKPEYISNVEVYEKDGQVFCRFDYDTYGDKYGNRKMNLHRNIVDSYIEKGWMEFDYKNIDSFRILDERCPIQKVKSINGENIEYEVSYYKFLGFESMPKHLFGTDQNGHDMLKKAFLGLRQSLVFAIIIAAICFIFGLVWGAISGYFGGNIDLFLERFKDILGGVPLVVIVTLFRLHLGDSIFIFGLSLCITGWLATASRTRTQFYRFKGREYVLASRTLGASDTRLIFKHILPNSLGTIVTSSILLIPSIIFTESSLSYLGLGLQGGNSFGVILSKNQQFLQNYPALIVFPSVIISLIMISFNLFGNGLRDALNPSLKGSE